MTNGDYPRSPGSDVRVAEKDWKQVSPFGVCPACGSPAMEDLAIPGDPEINFYCSDTTCRDERGRRTMWGAKKTDEVLALEAEGGSWNQWKFPEQDLPEACPD